jgi:asparagine synthase (glutamine-hydrolysing)
MCGICGSTADPQARAVAAMCAAMIYRGPDDEGAYVDPQNGVAVGARRLSIIDVSGGHQPVTNEDRTVWAVLNGEIYNHPRLQRRLQSRGHRLSSGTDTEVLVHLYEELGADLVHALEGMYAFAIWDRRHRRLLLARDRFGEKPLFFTERDGVLTFASELSALRAGLAGATDVEPAAVDGFFVLGYVGGEATMLRGVRQLAPGHLLTWSESDPVARARRYWTMPDRPAADDRAIDELVYEVETLLRGSVRTRLVADVPVGVFLSGGIDSTLVTALAAQEYSGKLRSFTVAYDVGSVNEDAPARAASRVLGTEHHELVLGRAEVGTHVPELLSVLDQPNADPALVALYGVAGLARRHVTVAVGGEGADELFGGYPRYRWLQRAARLGTAVPPALAGTLARVASSRASPKRLRRLTDVLDPKDPVERHVDWVTDHRRLARRALYGPRMQAHVADSGVVDDARRIVGDYSSALIPSRFMALDQRRWLPDDVLCKADRASMLRSLEVRTPFLERELAEFSAGIPTSVHLAKGGKALLRLVLQRVAPSLPEDRSKTAFRVPIADWLRGPLRSMVEDHVHEGRIVADEWLDGPALRRFAQEHWNGADYSSILWPAVVLGAWLDASGTR